MNTSFHKTALLLMLAFLFSISAFGQWEVGNTLPTLSGFQLSGKLPDDLSGKVVLLDFWASWCTPCKKSFPVLDALQRQYASEGLVVLAINVDEDAARMDRFLKDNPVSFPIVRDTTQKLVEIAQVESMPSSYLIDRQGVIRFKHNGFRMESTPAEYEKQIRELLGSTP